MSFKHIDPGYGWGFYDIPSIIKSNVCSPKFGIAFYTDSTSSIHLTNSSANLNEFYVRFDEYFPETANARTSFRNASSKTILLITQTGTNFSIQALGDDVGTDKLELTDDDTNLKAGRLNTIWIHVKTGADLWTITLVVNGETVFDESPSKNYSGTTYGTFNFEVDKIIPVSNLIISDEEVDPKETVAVIDSSEIETNMTENNGTYSSAQAGDYVLQILDTSNLYSTFGANGKVSGMVAIAAPAYTTGVDITKLKCRTVDGETVTDYDEQNLGTDANGVVAEYLTFDSDTTFASLNGFKVGWVTGA